MFDNVWNWGLKQVLSSLNFHQNLFGFGKQKSTKPCICEDLYGHFRYTLLVCTPACKISAFNQTSIICAFNNENGFSYQVLCFPIQILSNIAYISWSQKICWWKTKSLLAADSSSSSQNVVVCSL